MYFFLQRRSIEGNIILQSALGLWWHAGPTRSVAIFLAKTGGIVIQTKKYRYRFISLINSIIVVRINVLCRPFRSQTVLDTE